MKFKLTRNKIISIIAIVFILLLAFWYGGNAPGLQGGPKEPPKPKPSNTEETKEQEIEPEEEEELEPEEEPLEEPKEESKTEVEPQTKPEAELEPEPESEIKPEIKAQVKEKHKTDPIPKGKPTPKEPEEQEITSGSLSATLSVRCDTILSNLDWLDPEKIELVPKDGVIFAEKKVTFYQGESVFNVLQREMKQAKIHMEFTSTPIYNSSYVEGINNLYEFDCGELSGWIYKVNDWFPNYGASRYELEDGDTIKWLYTCNNGEDIGGNNLASK